MNGGGINLAGLLVVAAGAFLVVVALRNTQASVFPFFFGSTTTSAAHVPTTGAPTITGKCPPGQANVLGVCTADPHNCGDGYIWISATGTCVKVAG